MAAHDFPQWTDRSWLKDVQYRTDANLAARQSLYVYQHPRLNLPAWALDLAALTGDEAITDIGCGNGAYLAEVARRGHAGPVVGVDLSAGMLHAARRRAVRVALIAGDAAALPLRDDASDLTLAMHVLDHVPDPGAAVAELRRTTRPGGQVLVVLNRPDHLRELREAVASALPAQADGQPITIGGRLRLDDGARLLAREFTAVARHEVTSELLIPGPEPVESYIRSMTLTQALPRPSAFAAAVLRQLPRDQNGTIRIQAHTGCLVAS